MKNSLEMQLDQGHQLKSKQQQVLWEDSGFAEYFGFFHLVLMIKQIVFKFLFHKPIIIQGRSCPDKSQSPDVSSFHVREW